MQKILRTPDGKELRALASTIRFSQNSQLTPHILTCAADFHAPLELVPFEPDFSKMFFF